NEGAWHRSLLENMTKAYVPVRLLPGLDVFDRLVGSDASEILADWRNLLIAGFQALLACEILARGWRELQTQRLLPDGTDARIWGLVERAVRQALVPTASKVEDNVAE